MSEFTSNLYFDIENYQWPIIYSPYYNILFFGLERIYSFDTKKWKHIFKHLKEENLVSKQTIVTPREAKKTDLLVIHSKKHLKKLRFSIYVAIVAEFALIALVPNFILQKQILKPMRLQTGGTILAGKLALDRGWAINLGGGFHHCSAKKGGGFCAYADITLAIHFLFWAYPNKVNRVMIIDLDAHQGNGYARDFFNNSRVYILDVFNKDIYPFDAEAMLAIRKKVQVGFFIQDKDYLPLVERSIEQALSEFSPDIVVYNAGSDVLSGDKLGYMSITPEGIIQRDEIVFRKVRQRSIPIFMLTSGGYKKSSSKVVADSILNLYHKGLISAPT